MMLDVNSLHLWIFDANRGGEVDETLLSDQELERCNKFVFDKDKRMALMTRASIRRVLSLYCPDVSPRDWIFETNEYGRPHISEALNKRAISFSISHSNDVLLILISRNESNGVDVEWLDRDVNMDLADRYFSSLERAQLGKVSTEKKHSFIKIWTLKESFIKAIGKGFHYPISNLSFILPDNMFNKVLCWINDAMENGRWSFFIRAFDGDYFYSLALKEDEGTGIRQLHTYIVNDISKLDDHTQTYEVLDLN